VSVASQLISRLGNRSRLIARIGSDSFALLLHESPGSAAPALLDQVERAVQDLRLVHPSAHEPFLGCNLALLTVPTGQGEARHLLTHGELLLVEAQRGGRPRILDDHAPAPGAVQA
jgi:GGDEF domain-containing protein